MFLQRNIINITFLEYLETGTPDPDNTTEQQSLASLGEIWLDNKYLVTRARHLVDIFLRHYSSQYLVTDYITVALQPVTRHTFHWRITYSHSLEITSSDREEENSPKDWQMIQYLQINRNELIITFISLLRSAIWLYGRIREIIQPGLGCWLIISMVCLFIYR